MNKVILLTLFTWSFFSYARCQNTIEQGINDVSGQVKHITTKTDKIDQKLNRIAGNILELVVTVTDTKGKVSTESYRFNVADINQSGIKQGMSGEVMFVEVPIKENNKYIEETKSGKLSYTNSLRITVDDIDNSRALISALQSLVPEAEKLELQKYSFSSQEEIFTNLFKAIMPAGGYEQQMKSTPDKKEKLDLIINKDSKKELYEFNLSDINPTLINVSIGGFLGGANLSISLQTVGDQKAIKQFENDVPKSYVSKITIIPKDIENAKQIKNLFLLAIQNTKTGTTSLSGTAPAPSNSGSAVPSVSKESKTGTSGGQKDKGSTVMEALTTYSTVSEALVAAKNALLSQRFIVDGGIQTNNFTAKRTTGSHADYFVADVTAQANENNRFNSQKWLVKTNLNSL